MATTETRQYRGYDIVPMRQWSQWTDIVERLRVRPLVANDDPDIAEWRKSMEEAADEIEQLRAKNKSPKKGNVGVCEAIDDASDEATLEEINAEIQQLLNASARGFGSSGRASRLPRKRKNAVAEAKQKIDRIFARLNYPYAR